MLALFLAAATTVASPAPPATVADSCTPREITRLTSVPREKENDSIMEVDRRIAAALAEERRIGAEMTTAADRTGALAARAGTMGMAFWLLALVGLGMALLAARRGSAPIAVAAWALVAAAGFLGGRTAADHAVATAAHEQLLGSQFDAVQCRLRLTEARLTLSQARVSRTIHDLGEGAEDLAMWLSRTADGQHQISRTDIEHLRGELEAATR